MRRTLAVLAFLLVTTGSALAAYTLTRPDPAIDAVADGCQRDRGTIYTREAPEWAYVGDRATRATDPPPAPQWAEGVVNVNGANWFEASHPAGGDAPITHDAEDYNFNVLVDPAYADLVGGVEPARTGNFAGEGEETGRLHVEREMNAIPFFVWPTFGDRVRVQGSWIWDCGHFDPPGLERTELHPVRALWTQRTPSPSSPTGESEGDLFISTEKTPAGIEIDCAHRAKGDHAAFKACLLTEPRYEDAREWKGAAPLPEYQFVLRAPPKPAGASALRARVVDRGSTSGVTASVRIVGATAQVDVKTPSPAGQRIVVAKQVFLGWTRVPARSLPLHLRVTFTRLHIVRAMDPGCPPSQPVCTSKESDRAGQISHSPGEWNLDLDVAGVWRAWSPVVVHARDGQIFRRPQRFDIYLPRSRGFGLTVFSRECDFGSGAFSSQAAAMFPCPTNPAEFGNPIGDDVPGWVAVRYGSAARSPGSYKGFPKRASSTCPASNVRGCYDVDWQIVRVPDERTRAAR
ncbi:MAG: hypothetical protein QOE36_652 [Gaiellaceae bacterium]|nr:hypothetical protein [Gaiellaceae bacterium]